MSARERASGGGFAYRARWLVLGLLLLAGLAASVWLVDPAWLLEHGQTVAEKPWVTPALVLVMALLFALALPGSLLFWMIAPFHAPWIAVPWLLAGSVGGALGAYLVARYLGWGQRHARERGGAWLVRVLRARGDLPTQMAMRVLPGFPHSLVNYAGGLLKLPLGTFLLAALLGLTVKWGVYASAVHGAVEAVETGDALQPRILLPLVLLAFLLVTGAVIRRWWTRSGDLPRDT